MKKVLIIEDEKNIVLSLRMYLQSCGYSVETSNNGLSGIEKAFDFEPDLILLDIVLPKMNGYLVCEALKEDLRTRDIPIVFISAKTQGEDIKRAFEAGGIDYITKPFTTDDIKKTLQKYI